MCHEKANLLAMQLAGIVWPKRRSGCADGESGRGSLVVEVSWISPPRMHAASPHGSYRILYLA